MHKDNQHYNHSKLKMTSIFNNMELVKQKLIKRLVNLLYLLVNNRFISKSFISNL